MLEKNRKNIYETETAFSLAILLMNILILVIVGASAWLAHTAVVKNDALNSFLRGGFLP